MCFRVVKKSFTSIGLSIPFFSNFWESAYYIKIEQTHLWKRANGFTFAPITRHIDWGRVYLTQKKFMSTCLELILFHRLTTVSFPTHYALLIFFVSSKFIFNVWMLQNTLLAVQDFPIFIQNIILPPVSSAQTWIIWLISQLMIISRHHISHIITPSWI